MSTSEKRVAAYVARLRAAVALMYRDEIGFAEFDALQRATWDAAVADGCADAVMACVRERR